MGTAVIIILISEFNSCLSSSDINVDDSCQHLSRESWNGIGNK